MTDRPFTRPQVNLHVPDVAGVAAFYRRLGFRETLRSPADDERPHYVELVLEGMSLGIVSAGVARETHGLAVGPASARAELVVWVDDVDRRYLELVGAGTTPLAEPRDLVVGLRAAWVADPAGNPVQLAARPLTR